MRTNLISAPFCVGNTNNYVALKKFKQPFIEYVIQRICQINGMKLCALAEYAERNCAYMYSTLTMQNKNARIGKLCER
jgi:hypothetical protein